MENLEMSGIWNLLGICQGINLVMEKGTENCLLLVAYLILSFVAYWSHVEVHILIIDIYTNSTGILRVPLNVGKSAAYCQGILQCLESGHPVLVDPRCLSPTLNFCEESRFVYA